jgi:hypothetical protein
VKNRAVLVTLATVLSAALPRAQAPTTATNPTPAGSTTITGARLTVIDKSAKKLLVTIENQRDSPLIDWRIDSPWVSFGGRDLIPPHERRVVSIEIKDDRPATRPTTVALAAFEDGYYEANGRNFDRWVTERTERREDLAYWVKAFISMPRVSEPALRTFLSDHVTARTSGEPRMTRHVSDTVQGLMRQFPEGPEIWPRLDRLRKEVETEYIAATRVPIGGARSGSVERVTAATVVSTELRPSTSYSIVIENLRDVPIDAFGLENFDPANGRPKGGSWTDFCVTDPAEPGPRNERIPPHQKRDLGAKFGPGPVVPLVKLSFVMFEDLQFEGDGARRGELLRARETRAEDAAFALATLDDASAKPASELEGFFVARREAALKQRRRQGIALPLEQTIEHFLLTIRSSSAERFLAEIPATRARLEGQIARLRRHLSR